MDVEHKLYACDVIVGQEETVLKVPKANVFHITYMYVPVQCYVRHVKLCMLVEWFQTFFFCLLTNTKHKNYSAGN